MLKPDFVNDLCHNYMTVLYEGTADNFALKMLTENRTKEFLPVELRRLDGENFLYYDISGKQNIEIMYAERPIDKNAFQTFMWNLHEAMKQSKELFLPESGICLEPAMLFWSFQENRWMYAYLPYRDGKDIEAVQKEREQLAEFLVMRIDYEDKALTEVVYRFYEEICAGQIYPENFLKREKIVGAQEDKDKKKAEIRGQETEDEWKAGVRAEVKDKEEQKLTEDICDGEVHMDNNARYPEKEKRRKLILLILLFIAAMLTFVLSKYYQSVIVPGGMLCIVLSGMLLRVFIKHQPDCPDYPDCIEEPEEIVWQKRERALKENIDPSGNSITKKDIIWSEKGNISEEIEMEGISEGISGEIFKGNLDEVAEDTSDGTYDNRTVYIDIQKEQERKLYGIGKFRQQKILLHQLPCVIGKDRSLVNSTISDSSVSRMHVRIFEERGQLWMQDLNSTNGTYHNGLRLKPNEKVLLEPEDEVGIGRVQFVYR